MYSVTYNEYAEVDSEGSGGMVGELELLEQRGLNEGIGLHTFGLFHSHLQSVAADEACGNL